MEVREKLSKESSSGGSKIVGLVVRLSGMEAKKC